MQSPPQTPPPPNSQSHNTDTNRSKCRSTTRRTTTLRNPTIAATTTHCRDTSASPRRLRTQAKYSTNNWPRSTSPVESQRHPDRTDGKPRHRRSKSRTRTLPTVYAWWDCSFQFYWGISSNTCGSNTLFLASRTVRRMRIGKCKQISRWWRRGTKMWV